MERILVTGCAGFIGMHLTKSLLQDGYSVYGIDNINNYYDQNLKKNRVKKLLNHKNFIFSKEDICNQDAINSIFKKCKPEKVINLAAQAGVGFSLKNPKIYIKSNIEGFMNILEMCKKYEVNDLIYASSSSVYGAIRETPYCETHVVDKPMSIYAASKISNELMAYTYSHLYGINTTGLRFFSVYGPWGRPDMAIYLFTEKMIKGEKIRLFNHGRHKRDFTYIDDIVNGIKASFDRNHHFDIFNLGNDKPENLMDVVKLIEVNLGISAEIEYDDIQPGDIKETHANIDKSKKVFFIQKLLKSSVFQMNNMPSFNSIFVLH